MWLCYVCIGSFVMEKRRVVVTHHLRYEGSVGDFRVLKLMPSSYPKTKFLSFPQLIVGKSRCKL